MINYINAIIHLVENATFFMFFAYVGTCVLAIQFILNLFGLIDGEDSDDHSQVEARKFKCLSFQTLFGFSMMFGWTGLACQQEFGCQNLLSIVLSVIVGTGSVFIINFIFKLARKLHSSGNICNLDQVIGQEAYVYQRIPSNGVGKISISFPHLTCEIHAIANSEQEIESFTRVQIIKKKDDFTVVVIPIKIGSHV